jgi:hypothetical protein
MIIKPSSMGRTTSSIVRPFLSVLLLIAFVMADASAAAAGPRAYVLTNNSLVTFDTANPTQVSPPLAITGLIAGDTLVGIDFRPQNGFLYGLGFNSGAGTVTLYAISHRTGVATPTGTAGTFVDAGGNPLPVTGTSFGFDFNPAVDRIRVVTNTGQNFRMNPNTGAFVDGDLGGAVGSVAGLNMDGAINGGTTTLDGAAYTNNQPNNGSITTLYTLDAASNARYIQNPPNAGTQTLGMTLTLNGNPLDFTSVNGFDILPGVNAPVSNGPVTTGSGFAALSVGGVTSLYSINLVNGVTVHVGAIGNGASAVQGLALQGDAVPGGLPAIAVTANSLVRFNTVTPGTTTTQAVTGLQPGESLVGVDWRPQTGQLFALGLNAADGTGSASLYRLDPQTGAATLVGVAEGIADGTGTPINLAGAATFGFDFNPTVDRIRIVTDNGINFRVNPSTGAVVGTLDGNINGLPAGSTGVTGAAYTNSFGQSLTGGVTTLYTLDSASDSLFIQTPPNNGTQTMRLVVTLGGAPVDFTTTNGFDIPADVSVSTSNTAAVGRAYAQLVVGGLTRLYTIELSTGAATLIGAIGGGAPGITGLALGEGAKSATTTTVTSSANPSVAGQAVTFTATVSPVNATGTVAFTGNGTPIAGCNAQPIVAGASTCTTTLAASGGVSIVASYSGDNNHYASISAPFAQTVNPIATTLTLLGPTSPVEVGEPAQFIASLGFGITPTGTVTFRVDGAVAGTIPLNGYLATFYTTLLPAGTHEVIATYNGDAAHAASTSAPLTVTSATEVLAPFNQYFAEGATGFFQTDIGILNASKTNFAHVDVTLFPETGLPFVLNFSLAPLSRRSLDLNAILGPGQGVSTLVESDQPVGAMRQMTWGSPVYGSTLESGIPEKATTWYFAEGATNVFSLFYLIENPAPFPATVTLTHLLEGGAAPIVQSVTMPATSRRTFNINEVPGLATAALSTVITSTVPVVAERAMYLNSPQPLGAGTAGRGATALSTTWSLAEGATGFFHTYLLLGNPNTGEATVTVRYQLPDGTAFDKDYAVPGQSRRTIDVNFEDARLASTAVGMSITSTLPIVSERAMWWGDPFIEGSVAIGSTATGTAWAIGEGGEGGTLAEGTFVLVANGSSNPGTVRFTVVYDDGTNEQKDYDLLGSARLTVRIGDDFAKAREAKFSVLVESVTAGMPIAVEVARYQSAGTILGAGGAAPATRIQ